MIGVLAKPNDTGAPHLGGAASYIFKQLKQGFSICLERGGSVLYVRIHARVVFARLKFYLLWHIRIVLRRPKVEPGAKVVHDDVEEKQVAQDSSNEGECEVVDDFVAPSLSLIDSANTFGAR